MRSNSTKKLAISAIFVALAVVGRAFVSFPVFGSKCSPTQHMVNVLCAVFLGPGYGVGVAFCASPWRLAEAGKLLAAFRPDILRVNLSEARALLGLAGREKGVDSAWDADRQTRASVAAELAAAYDCAVLLSGEEDIVADGRRAAAITGGSPLTPLVTGTGCMLSVLCGAFAAVEPNAFDAALMASVFWKACSERAEHVSGGAGPGSLRAALMDSARALVPGSPCFDGRVQAL